MIWIYVFEDGSVKWSDEGPHDVDRVAISEGCLQVVQVEGTLNGQIDADGSVVALEQAEVAQVCGESWHE